MVLTVADAAVYGRATRQARKTNQKKENTKNETDPRTNTEMHVRSVPFENSGALEEEGFSFHLCFSVANPIEYADEKRHNLIFFAVVESDLRSNRSSDRDTNSFARQFCKTFI